jgi:hypothetical protein
VTSGRPDSRTRKETSADAPVPGTFAAVARSSRLALALGTVAVITPAAASSYLAAAAAQQHISQQQAAARLRAAGAYLPH